MSWTLEWSYAARRDLLAIHWRAAGRIGAALMRYADTGRGAVAQLVPGDPRRLLVAAPGAVAIVFLDPEASTLFVQRVYARDR